MKATILASLVLALSVAACGAPSEGAAPQPDPCAAFNECTTHAGASIDCADGECACMYTHPGENAVTRCAMSGK